jgi:hypothetical protein
MKLIPANRRLQTKDTFDEMTKMEREINIKAYLRTIRQWTECETRYYRGERTPENWRGVDWCRQAHVRLARYF